MIDIANCNAQVLYNNLVDLVSFRRALTLAFLETIRKRKMLAGGPCDYQLRQYGPFHQN